MGSRFVAVTLSGRRIAVAASAAPRIIANTPVATVARFQARDAWPEAGPTPSAPNANPGFARASPNAFALSNRSAGNFSSALATAAATFDGTILRRTVTSGAGSVMIFMINAFADDA